MRLAFGGGGSTELLFWLKPFWSYLQEVTRANSVPSPLSGIQPRVNSIPQPSASLRKQCTFQAEIFLCLSRLIKILCSRKLVPKIFFKMLFKHLQNANTASRSKLYTSTALPARWHLAGWGFSSEWDAIKLPCLNNYSNILKYIYFNKRSGIICRRWERLTPTLWASATRTCRFCTSYLGLTINKC